MGFSWDFLVINRIFNGINGIYPLINGIFNGILMGFNGTSPAWSFTVCELENGSGVVDLAMKNNSMVIFHSYVSYVNVYQAG
jgi:hypothetical protein